MKTFNRSSLVLISALLARHPGVVISELTGATTMTAKNKHRITVDEVHNALGAHIEATQHAYAAAE
jgi:hypothetical protein